MEIKAKSVEYRICSNCGKEFKQDYGDFLEGSINIVNIDSTRRSHIVDFHFCIGCSLKAKTATISHISKSLSKGEKI